MKLTAFEAAKKLLLIKEIRTFLSLGLKEAKDFVEKTPTVLKSNCKIEEAEEIKIKFKELATIEFE